MPNRIEQQTRFKACSRPTASIRFLPVVTVIISLLLVWIPRLSHAEDEPIRVACVGDSITAGARVDQATESYPARLSVLLGEKYEVRNFGIGGATLLKSGSPNVWRRLDKVKSFAPQVIVIVLGTNDTTSLRRANWQRIDRFENDYKQLLKELARLPSAPRIVVCSPTDMVLETPGMSSERIAGLTRRRPRLQELCRRTKEIAENSSEENVEFLDLNPVLRGKPEFLTGSDGVHPNAAGYDLIARHVWATIARKPLPRSPGGNADLAHPSEKSGFKILNWNVLYSFNHGKSTEQGTQWIQSQKPDVVALQELNGNSHQSFARMAKLWNHQHSALLKESGFPVGLSSSRPIQVIERRLVGFHHGYLHCKTHGIHFLVVHLWPTRDDESLVITAKVNQLTESGERVVVLGDFNANTPLDLEFLSQKEAFRSADFKIMKRFNATKLVDLTNKHDDGALISCPSPIVIPRWHKDMQSVKNKQSRIDYIFVGPVLAPMSISSTILIDDNLDKISDHYPVVATLEYNAEHD